MKLSNPFKIGRISRQELRHGWPVLFHCLSAFGPLAARAVQIFATLVESEEAPQHMTKVLQCSLDAVDEARKPLTRISRCQMEFEKFDKCQNCPKLLEFTAGFLLFPYIYRHSLLDHTGKDGITHLQHKGLKSSTRSLCPR